MNYNYLLKTYNVDKQKLLDYGFVESDGYFNYRRDLLNGLYVTVQYAENKLNVDVMDGIFNEKYAPFVSGHGGSAIKGEVREILTEILEKCSVKFDAKSALMQYIEQTYSVSEEYPWEDDSVDFVYRAKKSQKWFALFMKINLRQLGLQSDQPCYVVNVKIAPEKVATLVDNEHCFLAYHMNKKHWMTLLLDANTDMDLAKKLIDDSYSAVEK